jgi:hypothetical protein
MFDAMSGRSDLFSVYHPTEAREIGTVRKVLLGRNRREFWEARSLDGVDLGAHVSRVDAEWAIQDDWEAGRPRNSRSSGRERYRPVYDQEPPIYLGRG